LTFDASPEVANPALVRGCTGISVPFMAQWYAPLRRMHRRWGTLDPLRHLGNFGRDARIVTEACRGMGFTDPLGLHCRVSISFNRRMPSESAHGREEAGRPQGRTR
jgi:hypothetical protein